MTPPIRSPRATLVDVERALPAEVPLGRVGRREKGGWDGVDGARSEGHLCDPRRDAVLLYRAFTCLSCPPPGCLVSTPVP